MCCDVCVLDHVDLTETVLGNICGRRTVALGRQNALESRDKMGKSPWNKSGCSERGKSFWHIHDWEQQHRPTLIFNESNVCFLHMLIWCKDQICRFKTHAVIHNKYSVLNTGAEVLENIPSFDSQSAVQGMSCLERQSGSNPKPQRIVGSRRHM